MAIPAPAGNPYVNKVVLGSGVMIDLTGDTVTPASLLPGTTAHDKRGAPVEGNASVVLYSEPQALKESQKAQARSNIGAVLPKISDEGVLNFFGGTGFNTSWIEACSVDTFTPESDVSGGHTFSCSLGGGLLANVVLLISDMSTSSEPGAFIGAVGYRFYPSKRPNFDGTSTYWTSSGGVSVQSWAGSSATPKGVETSSFTKDSITFFPPYSGGVYTNWAAGYNYTLVALRVNTGE